MLGGLSSLMFLLGGTLCKVRNEMYISGSPLVVFSKGHTRQGKCEAYHS